MFMCVNRYVLYAIHYTHFGDQRDCFGSVSYVNLFFE